MPRTPTQHCAACEAARLPGGARTRRCGCCLAAEPCCRTRNMNTSLTVLLREARCTRVVAASASAAVAARSVALLCANRAMPNPYAPHYPYLSSMCLYLERERGARRGELARTTARRQRRRRRRLGDDADGQRRLRALPQATRPQAVQPLGLGRRHCGARALERDAAAFSAILS